MRQREEESANSFGLLDRARKRKKQRVCGAGSINLLFYFYVLIKRLKNLFYVLSFGILTERQAS